MTGMLSSYMFDSYPVNAAPPYSSVSQGEDSVRTELADARLQRRAQRSVLHQHDDTGEAATIVWLTAWWILVRTIDVEDLYLLVLRRRLCRQRQG